MSRYRIRAVSELVGVSIATLRAWERRYGVPTPARTASAYRLYSDADVQTIRQMNDLVQGGMAPAEASRQVLAEGRASVAPASEEPIDPYAAACDRIVAATVDLSPDAVELEVARALTLGPALTIFERALGPALTRIGDLWHDGTITIAEEHLASQIITNALGDLVRLAQPAEASRRAVLACFADEDHVAALHGVALQFASWGFRVVVVGARTPPSAIGRVVEALAPDVVALSATITPAPARARELIDAYADACRDVVWLVGGQASASLRPWVERRGGLVAEGGAAELRRLVDKAIAERRKQKG